MLDPKKIIEDTKDRYFFKQYGKYPTEYNAPEMRVISRQVESLAEVLVAAINEELTRGRPT